MVFSSKKTINGADLIYLSLVRGRSVPIGDGLSLFVSTVYPKRLIVVALRLKSAQSILDVEFGEGLSLLEMVCPCSYCSYTPNATYGSCLFGQNLFRIYWTSKIMRIERFKRIWRTWFGTLSPRLLPDPR